MGRMVSSPVGRMVDGPMGGYVGCLLVVLIDRCPGCCLGVADSTTRPSQAAPDLGIRGVALLVGVPAVAGPCLGSQHAFVACRGDVEHHKRGESDGVLSEESPTPAKTVRVRATAVPTVLLWLGLRPLPLLADSSSVGLLPPGPSSLTVLVVAPSLLSVGILVGVVSRRQSLARSAGSLRQPP